MEEFKSPILVTGTFTPGGTQDVNIVSPIPVPVTTTGGGVTSSVVTRIPSSLTNQIVVVANPLRKALFIYNDGTAEQYVKLGTLASNVDFTVLIPSKTYYEMPQPIYPGQIDFISSTTNGAIQVTELS